MKIKIFAFCLACLLSVVAEADYQIAWQERIAGTSAFDVALGDIDGDGDIDAILVHLTSAANLLLNNGSGVYTVAAHAPLPAAGAVAMADINADGHLDLFFACHLAPCEVWLGNGDGTFTKVPQNVSISRARRSVALADLNTDGKLDVILPHDSFDHPSEIWFGNGDGTFVNSGQSLELESFTTHVSVIDLDEQNGPDLVFGVNGKNTIWFNNGSGIFAESNTPLGLGFNSTFDIAFADLNGDGRPDAYVANGSISPESSINEVWIQNPDGTFTKKADQTFNSNYSFAVQLRDIDLDGDLDAIVGNSNGFPNEIWVNDGSANFTLAPKNLGSASVISIAVADLDGDGDDDYFLAVNGNPSEIWSQAPPAQGGPIKDTGQRIGSNSATCIAKADLNGDGHEDIVLGSTSGILRVLLNNGTGQFNDAGQTPAHGPGNQNAAIAIGDLNGDNHPDLYIVNTTWSALADNKDKVWLNDGSGNFTAGPELTDAFNGGAAAILDVNNDGAPDVIVVNREEGLFDGQNRVLINDGNANFTASNALGAGTGTAVGIADLNGNGHLDVFIGGGGLTSPNSVWINNGNGTFTKTPQDLASNTTAAVTIFDADNDGDLDVFCASVGGPSILWLNNGNGTFASSPQAFLNNTCAAAVVLDHNGNGTPDLWLGFGSQFQSADRIYLNDGNGAFTLGQSFPARATRAMVAADFNNDGDIDVFIASYQGDHVLYAAGSDEVQQYAASFGLTGTDIEPFEDPDGDGILNFEEMAFNMNPAVADAQRIGNLSTATSGLPRIRIEVNGTQKTFFAETIRRISSETLDYRLEISPFLTFSTVPPGVTMTTSPLNANYERATYQFIVPGNPPRAFGRFRVGYSP